jgi:hypothetical protein
MAFLTQYLEILGLQEKVPASAGSWFQLFMVLNRTLTHGSCLTASNVRVRKHVVLCASWKKRVGVTAKRRRSGQDGSEATHVCVESFDGM